MKRSINGYLITECRFLPLSAELIKFSFHFRFHKRYIKGMRVNVRFTFNRTPLKLMHRALEISLQMIEERTPVASLNLAVGTHLDPLLKGNELDFR